MNFLTEAFVFLLAALAVVPLLNRLGLSSVIGYLCAGILIGPSGLALVGHAEETLHFAEIGVVFLLFIIGLELQPSRLWVMRRWVFGLGAAQVGAITLALTLALWLALSLPLQASAVLGFALALSSTAFVLQLLAEKGELNYAHGRAAFGVLLFQDVAVIPALVLLSALAASADAHGNALTWTSLGMTLALVIAARFLLKPLLRFIAATGIHELFIAASLAIVCGAALAMQAAGLSMGLGAFIAGMLVADSEYRHQLETDVMPFKGLLLGLFFIAVGMSADLGLILQSPLLVLGLTAALVCIKAVILFPVALLFGMKRPSALRTSLVLSQGGEFAFVLLTAATGAQIIERSAMEMAVLVVTLSMATTPFLMILLERLIRTGETDRAFDTLETVQDPIIIAGFGRFGQIVGRILTAQNQPFTALDINPGQVDFVRGFGNEVYYGDATRLDLMQTAGIAKARAVVIAVDDIEASVKIVEMLRDARPDLALFARARNRQHEIKLRDLGVRYVIRETLLSSLDLTRNLFALLDLDGRAIDAFKAHDERTLERQAAVAHDDKAFRQTTLEASSELKALFAEDHDRDSEKPAALAAFPPPEKPLG